MLIIYNIVEFRHTFLSVTLFTLFCIENTEKLESENEPVAI